MPIYIALVNWTEKGISEVKNSPARADASHELARKLGGELKELYLTMGGYDMVAISDMPSDEAAAKFALMAGSGGAIRTTTLKAFDEASYRRIIGSL